MLNKWWISALNYAKFRKFFYFLFEDLNGIPSTKVNEFFNGGGSYKSNKCNDRHWNIFGTDDTEFDGNSSKTLKLSRCERENTWMFKTKCDSSEVRSSRNHLVRIKYKSVEIRRLNNVDYSHEDVSNQTTEKAINPTKYSNLCRKLTE